MRALVLMALVLSGCWLAAAGPGSQRTGRIEITNATMYDGTVYAVRSGSRVCKLAYVIAHTTVEEVLRERCLTSDGFLRIRFVPSTFRGRGYFDLYDPIMVTDLPALVELRLMLPWAFSSWRVRRGGVRQQ